MTNDFRSASLTHLVHISRHPKATGHEAAFREIARRFRANALASAYYLLGDSHLAQDVVQEALLDAYLGLAQLREPAAFPGWFRRIVFKHADRIRRRPRPPFERADSLEALLQEVVSPETWTATRESIGQVREALVELPKHERDVVVLFYFAERSHAEIGQQLFLPLSTIKKRLHDARRRLRSFLEEMENPTVIGPGQGRVVEMASERRDSEPRIPRPVDDPILRGDEALRLAAIATVETREVLSRFPPDQVAAAIGELSAGELVSFLEVSDRLPDIVPCLPELTLVQTIRRVGLDEAGWLIEFASPEQRVAALDLDCWQDRRLSPGRVFEWIDALIEAGTETLVCAFDDFDAEIWILILQWMADFSIPGGGLSAAGADGDDDEDEIPYGCTEDGFVYYDPIDADHEARLHTILSAARVYRPSHYWDIVYGAITEPTKGCEEVATHWHKRRLNDLGFPDLGEAMKVYKPLSIDAVPKVESMSAPPPNETPIPALLEGSALGRGLSELEASRSGEIQDQLFALANAVAVADRLPLAEAAALEYSLRKAVEGVDRGLVALATAHMRSVGETVDTTPARDLFRIGVALNPELHPQPTLGELEETEKEEATFDWAVLDEWLAEADETFGDEGALRNE
jgi:RNA polymerase sigma factor (sigma-70 family)